MDYTSNSHKSNEDDKKKAPVEKKVEKVITGEVVTKKPPLGKKIKNVFFGGEFSAAARYIAADVLLPALRNLIVDASTEGIRRMVYGDSTMSRRRPPEYRPRVQYNSPIIRHRDDPRDRMYLPDQPPHSPIRNRMEANEIIIPSREEAELVLDRLIDILDKYQVASLADLYDLVGLPSSHTDNKWGWTYLSNTSIRQVREGFMIELPTMEPL